MWIMPAQRGLPPEVEQKVFTKEDRTDRLLEVFSPGGGRAAKVHRDVWAYVSRLMPGSEAKHAFGAGRGAYLYVISGDVAVNDERLRSGDSAKVRDEQDLFLRADDATELILADLPID